MEVNLQPLMLSQSKQTPPPKLTWYQKLIGHKLPHWYYDRTGGNYRFRNWDGFILKPLWKIPIIFIFDIITLRFIFWFKK